MELSHNKKVVSLVPSGVSQNRIQCQTNAFSLFAKSVRYTVNTYEIEVFSGFSHEL